MNRPLSPAQRIKLTHYQRLDPDLRILGYHRSSPQHFPCLVIHTHISPPIMRMHGDKRHVIVITRIGEPFDLPESWREGFQHTATTPEGRTRVSRIIDDWLSWSIRV